MLAEISWETLGSAGSTIAVVVIVLSSLVWKIVQLRNGKCPPGQTGCPHPEHVVDIAKLQAESQAFTAAVGGIYNRLGDMDKSLAATREEVATMNGRLEKVLNGGRKK